MTTLRFFEVKFSGPTNRRGARVLIHDMRFDKRRSIEYGSACSFLGDAAAEYLKSKGITVEYIGEKNGADLILGTTNLTNQI